jgi:two-component system chemotaxis response regulator CheB
MPGHDIVVVGFSAGGIDPLQTLVADLPGDFRASIFVVHHFPAIAPVARPGHHLLQRDRRIRLTGPA